MQMIALGMLILAAHLGGKLFTRLRMSKVTGQLLGGAMVGLTSSTSWGFSGDPAEASTRRCTRSTSSFSFS